MREQLARYRLLGRLGQGGMGVVHRAFDESLGREVALKVLTPDFADDDGFRQRFIRESRLAAAIEHPNVIPVYEAGEDGGTLFIAMRLVRGIDLRQALAFDAPLDPGRTVAIGEQIAGALDAAHRTGLVHRDVKPGNVMIDAAGGREHCYLTDFGLTKDLSASSGLTMSGQALGTLPYMAPEQVEGRPLDGRADQYALGCVLFECLTGSVPFTRDSAVALMYAQLHEPPPSVCAVRPELPAGVDVVISRALAKAAEDRFPSCCDMVDALRSALAGEPVAAFEPTRRSSHRFSRPEPVAAPVLEPAFAPPASANGNGYAPPAPPVPSPGGGRWSVRAALIVSLALVLAGVGVAAALLLRDGGDAPSSQQAATQRLIERTIELNVELDDLSGDLHRVAPRVPAELRVRIEEDRREADALREELRSELDAANDTRKELIEANRRQIAALKAAEEYRRKKTTALLEELRREVTRAERAAAQARAGVGVDLPPVPEAPSVSGARKEVENLVLPSDALGEVTPAPGERIVSVREVGDVDADGTTDFGIVTEGDSGSTGHVVFGGRGEDVDLFSLGGGGFQIPGAEAIAPAGEASGDEYGDLAVISSSDAATPSPYLVYGKDDADEVSLFDLGTAGRLLALPAGTGDELAATPAGDFDGDGIDDLLVGDPLAGDGVAHVVFGGDAADAESIVIEGDGGRFGASVAPVGDVNGDDLTDLVVGAPDEAGGGAAYVVFGSPDRIDVELPGDGGFRIGATEPGAEAGTVVAGVGDLDEDGADDVLVTAPGTGTAYVVFSGDATDVDLGERGYAIEGGGSRFGASAASIGDVNGDDLGDVVLGAPGASGAQAYVVYGQDGSDPIDLGEPGEHALGFELPGVDAASPPAVAGGFHFDSDDTPDLLLAPSPERAYAAPATR